jgi:prolyl oligopeptidase
VRSYPPTRTGSDVDDYHGQAVSDPYRWLENTDDQETRGWIKAQNELTESFLAAVPAREAIRARLTDLWDYPKYGVPFERGGRWFQSRNSGLAAQPVLYVMEAPDAAGRPLLDPNVLAADGTVALSEINVSDDGRLLAYAASDMGSDWQTWRVRDVTTGADLDDKIEWSKFSAAAWRPDGSGFFYGAVEPATPGAEYLEANPPVRIFFHRMGTRQDDDQLVFAAGEPDWNPYAVVSDDGRYLIISIDRGTSENQVHVLDLEDPDASIRQLVADFISKAIVVTNVGTTFYLVTDYAADRQRLVAVDLDNPARENWREIIPQAEEILLDGHFFGGRLVCHYLRQAHSVLRVHALDGALVHEIPVPGIASLGVDAGHHLGIAGRPGSDMIHFQTVSFTESGSLWSHQLSTGQTRLIRPSSARIDTEKFVTEQVFAPSADGTPIPMFLTRRRDLAPDGDVPVLLYAYGGFDIAITPSFSALRAAWLDRGGLLAIANLRGGGEYGHAWHEGGMLDRKQNVFDDFCGCAQWLADSGWSRPGRIAIMGGSNGGLLVGACLTQQPGLFGACVAEVGVFDMLRFPKFTIGWAWTGELGDPDDPEQFRWLRGYSPLHNIRPGTHYPPTLLLTGDHDDRVVPGHTFKFTAALQAAQGGDAPILARIDIAAGHGAGKPTAKAIAAGTDVLAFLEAVLGPAEGHELADAVEPVTAVEETRG